jgi:uncharacterized protein (DUF1800 family)
MPSQYEKIAHLMRRAAFGATPAEINARVSQGIEATVDELVNHEQVTEDPTVPLVPATSAGSTDIALISIDDVAAWWLSVMLRTKRPLRERMVLFWHDHFATSYEKVMDPSGAKHLYWQNQLERQHATGNFRDLCKGMNRDAAMVRWLDSTLSTKKSPNENYGRELFEIFMLGFAASQDGTYTETDVQQAARAFTGWGWKILDFDRVDANKPNAINGNIAEPGLVPIPIPSNNAAAMAQHDTGVKTIFGVAQNFDGDDVIDLVLNKEPQRTASARMLSTKIFEHFAYEDPEPYVIDHLSSVLLRTNFSIKALLRDLFLNVKEFYSERAIQSLTKWPTVYLVSALRLLSLGGINPRGYNTNNLRVMGQWLFWPPDVFGWTGREDWISTSQILNRDNFANSIVSSQTNLPNAVIAGIIQAAGIGATPTAEQVVDYFSSLLVQVSFAPAVRQALVDYLKKPDSGVVGTFSLTTDATANYKKIRGLLHVLLSRPECQNH